MKLEHKGMNEMRKYTLYNADADLSRRHVLKGATALAAGVAAATFAGDSAFAKPKRTQADVAYQDFPKGGERCDNCEPFIAPDKCKTVEGTVSAKGWCKIYVAK
jgi:hypothetical protein